MSADFGVNQTTQKFMKLLPILAQTDLSTGLGKVLGIIQAISIVVLVASLVFSGVNITTGRTEAVWHGILGAAISALAFVLVRTLFSSIGGSVIDISPQSF